MDWTGYGTRLPHTTMEVLARFNSLQRVIRVLSKPGGENLRKLTFSNQSNILAATIGHDTMPFAEQVAHTAQLSIVRKPFGIL